MRVNSIYTGYLPYNAKLNNRPSFGSINKPDSVVGSGDASLDAHASAKSSANPLQFAGTSSESNLKPAESKSPDSSNHASRPMYSCAGATPKPPQAQQQNSQPRLSASFDESENRPSQTPPQDESIRVTTGGIEPPKTFEEGRDIPVTRYEKPSPETGNLKGKNPFLNEADKDKSSIKIIRPEFLLSQIFMEEPVMAPPTFDVTDAEKVTRIVNETDDARLDLSQLGLYIYGNSMIKTPDPKLETNVLKEFFALSRIRQYDQNNNSTPVVIAAAPYKDGSGRYFLVEEFIDGTMCDAKTFSMSQIMQSVQRALILDRTGVVNRDLSPENIISAPDGQSVRFIDFDYFTYLDRTGKVKYSDSTPGRFFDRLLENNNIFHDDDDIYHSRDLEPFRAQMEQMYADSFVYKPNPKGTSHALSKYCCPADNPYLIVPSNLTSFETRTLFPKIMSGSTDDPCEFLKDYLQLKSALYHRGMAEYLKTLPPPQADDFETDEKYSQDQAQKRLEQAIEYEEFLADLFDERPDDYFAKLEAAKIQLNAFLHFEDLDPNISNGEQIGTAYRNLMDIIDDGLYEYRDTKFQRYLYGELEKYTNAFLGNSQRNYSKYSNRPISKHLDILQNWFSDVAKNPNSFSVKRHQIIDSVIRVIELATDALGTNNLPVNDLEAQYGALATSIATELLDPINFKFLPHQYQIERERIVKDAFNEFVELNAKKQRRLQQQSPQRNAQNTTNPFA